MEIHLLIPVAGLVTNSTYLSHAFLLMITTRTKVIKTFLSSDDSEFEIRNPFQATR